MVWLIGVLVFAGGFLIGAGGEYLYGEHYNRQETGQTFAQNLAQVTNPPLVNGVCAIAQPHYVCNFFPQKDFIMQMEGPAIAPFEFHVKDEVAACVNHRGVVVYTIGSGTKEFQFIFGPPTPDC